MTIREYQALAARTINQELTQIQLTDHALLGLGSEVGEVMGLFQKVYQGHVRSDEQTIKEMGDVLWFLAELATALGVELEDIARQNIDKLLGRYHDGFSADKSVNRPEYANQEKKG